VSAPVTGVTLNKTSLALAPGEKFTLEPVFTPANPTNQKVSWESDTPSVVTVSDAGLVTAKATGTAKITVTTKDGNKTATCDVTVVIPVTNITGVPERTDYVAAKYLWLSDTKYRVVPHNATYQTVVWSVKDAAGTGAYFRDDNTLFVSNWGTVTVTATIVNGKGLQDYTQDFNILFRDRIMITSLKIDDCTIKVHYPQSYEGLPYGNFHWLPLDADTDVLGDMRFILDDPSIAELHSTMTDRWVGLRKGTTRVKANFRQLPLPNDVYFNLTVVE
jgi:uncharacterized protein YjdB